jgi:hypothetical protein
MCFMFKQLGSNEAGKKQGSLAASTASVCTRGAGLASAQP